MEFRSNPDEKLKILKDIFGYTSFRPAQSDIIDNILSGRDVLAVMPTGAGKSLCFQIPALLSDGITVVISPLISLMADQVNSLVQSGVRAAYYNSTLTAEQQRKVRSNILSGVYKIVYVSPERLDTEGFISLAERMDISMIAVDEAHCISQWGQDFRPSYLNIVIFADSLPRRPVIAAFTATATERVKEDIINILSLNDPYCITTGFDRPNLYFGTEQPQDKYKALISHLEEYKGKCGIIYCSTRKNVETVAMKLIDDGYSAAPYHAGMSDSDRKKNQEDFIYDRINVIVATNAFGMGIDKSNVSFVIHYNMPKDMESYYQEAGRAGRDGSPAECIILYSGGDYGTARFMINSDSSSSREIDEDTRRMLIKRDMKRLDFMYGYCTGTSCLRRSILGYFGEITAEECGNCSVCLSDSAKTDITTEAQKIMSCIFRMGQNYGSSLISSVLRGKKTGRVLSLGFDSLPTFGILTDMTDRRLTDIINRLIAMNYIAKTDDEYPVLKLTPKSTAVLKGKEHIETLLPPERVSKRRLKEESEGKYASDPLLLSALKELRLKISKEKNIPAYTVFTDATLRDMCAKLPQTREEMLSVSGVGSRKLDSYGDVFLEEIKKYLSENGGNIRKLSEEEKNTLQQSPLSAVLTICADYSPSDENLTISRFCDALIDEAGVNIPQKTVREAMYRWLMSRGYLTEKTDSMGKTCKAVTDSSADIGIITELRTALSGKQYENIVYTPKAQLYITEHFQEIAKL